MIVLGLGTNMGEREQNFVRALRLLQEQYRIKVQAVSSIYETAPFGVTDQSDFLNMTALVTTRLSPRTLLQACLQVEQEMGRVRTRHWGPRIIDIDILLYNEIKLTVPELTLPHPGILQRGFVIIPLRDVSPDLVFSNGCTVAEVAEAFEKEAGDVRLWKKVRWDPDLLCFS